MSWGAGWSTPAGFPAAPTMLAASGWVNLVDASNPANTFLQVQATNYLGWPALFGVATQVSLTNPVPPNAQPPFNLFVYYNPPLGEVGVTLPVQVHIGGDEAGTDPGRFPTRRR